MRMLAGLVMLVAVSATAQFEILDGKTTASLRGIDAVSAEVAWASGSGGTVLLTIDGGANWKHCAVPEGAEKLDFRGVQGFDAKTAVIMASGKGPASAIYKTTDGCASWTLVFANPDVDGFFDALFKTRSGTLFLMGDQVNGRFTVFSSNAGGTKWVRDESPGLEAPKGAGGFAASNSGFAAVDQDRLMFATGATAASAPMVYSRSAASWKGAPIPMPANGSSSGIFSLASTGDGKAVVAVGGNYTKPTETTGTAAYSVDGGEHWRAAATMPSGYRSAVAHVAGTHRWITVGPTGADISKDDGKTWSPLTPQEDDAANTDKNWNAISLPFVVGGRGKIGKLKDGALGK